LTIDCYKKSWLTVGDMSIVNNLSVINIEMPCLSKFTPFSTSKLYISHSISIKQFNQQSEHRFHVIDFADINYGLCMSLFLIFRFLWVHSKRNNKYTATVSNIWNKLEPTTQVWWYGFIYGVPLKDELLI